MLQKAVCFYKFYNALILGGKIYEILDRSLMKRKFKGIVFNTFIKGGKKKKRLATFPIRSIAFWIGGFILP
jgi:hypothetical protein